jgi:hypothetical protein
VVCAQGGRYGRTRFAGLAPWTARSLRLALTQAGQDPPSRFDVLLDLSNQILDAIKPSLIPQSGHELDHQVTAVNVFVKIQEMSLNGRPTVVEARSHADVSHRRVARRAEHGKRDIDAIRWYGPFGADLQVGCWKTQLPSSVGTAHYLTGYAGVAPQHLRGVLYSAFAQERPDLAAGDDHVSAGCMP